MKRYAFCLIILLICILYAKLVIPHKNDLKQYNIGDTSNQDIYDVILFWGQSNMAGSAGNLLQGATYRDLRVDELGIDQFSKLSEIDKDIVNQYVYMDYVKVPTTPNTVFDYRYLSNSLVEINQNTTTIGECVGVKNVGGVLYYSGWSLDSPCSMVGSLGTNMMPYFGKTYYEKTGHKVIIVAAGLGGHQLATFLPYERAVVETKPIVESDKPNYQYEAMVEKYKKAINYLSSKNYQIGNKFYVVFQGENDAYVDMDNPSGNIDRYVRIFKEIHDDLKKDLGLQFGVIVETSGTVSQGYLNVIKPIHQAQERLINENSDIILGSDYPYRRFVPNKVTYEGNDYDNDVAKALLGVCVKKGEAVTDEAIHYNSAALSQIGKESAINTVTFLNRSDIILGDVNGDGKVSINDYMLIRRHILGTSKLNSDEKIRADANEDDKINQYDYMIVRKSILYGIAINSKKTSLTTKTEITKNESNSNETIVSNLSGWKQENGIWYYYINNKKATGWQQLDWNGLHWFYFDDATGAMITGCHKLSWAGTLYDFCFDSSGICTSGPGC